MPRIPSLLPLGLLLATAGAAVADPHGPPPLVLAGDMIDDHGGSERIELADHLRTLTQEMASATCRLHNRTDVAHTSGLVDHAIAEFDLTLRRLLDGDPALHMDEGETHPKLRRGLEKAAADWAPIREAALAVRATPDDAAAAAVVFDGTEALLLVTDQLEAEIAGTYANPVELLQADAFLLDVAGKQAMYSQRIAYEACRVLFDDRSPERRAELETVAGYFHNALTVLHDGHAGLGIPPAPTPEILAGLEEAAAEWSVLHALVDRVLAGEALTEPERVTLFEGLDREMTRMEALTHLYGTYSKRVI